MAEKKKAKKAKEDFPEPEKPVSICVNCGSTAIERRLSNQRVFFYCRNCEKTLPFTLVKGGELKTGKAKSGELKHYTVGAIIERDGKLLLFERSFYPFGFASPAGHLHKGEEIEEALKREIEEETGLKATSLKKLLHEEVQGNKCSYGVNVHEWHLFQAKCSGKVKKSDEAVSMDWYDRKDLEKLKLEPVWSYFFKKLKMM